MNTDYWSNKLYIYIYIKSKKTKKTQYSLYASPSQKQNSLYHASFSISRFRFGLSKEPRIRLLLLLINHKNPGQLNKTQRRNSIGRSLPGDDIWNRFVFLFLFLSDEVDFTANIQIIKVSLTINAWFVFSFIRC